MDKKDQEKWMRMVKRESKCESWEEFCKSENKILELLQGRNVKSESIINLMLKN